MNKACDVLITHNYDSLAKKWNPPLDKIIPADIFERSDIIIKNLPNPSNDKKLLKYLSDHLDLVFHHNENLRTLELIPRKVHAASAWHIGGDAAQKHITNISNKIPTIENDYLSKIGKTLPTCSGISCIDTSGIL